jgi:nucleoside-triphosphatase THEP1
MNIAITGMQGVGKSALYDYLSGKAYQPGYQPPLQSQKLERERVKQGGKRLLFSVIPGQSEGAAPRLEAIDKVFGPETRLTC